MGRERHSGSRNFAARVRKSIDLEGRIIKDGVRKALRDRKLALTELVNPMREYRTIAESKTLTLQGWGYTHAVRDLNKAIDQTDGCCWGEACAY